MNEPKFNISGWQVPMPFGVNESNEDSYIKEVHKALKGAPKEIYQKFGEEFKNKRDQWLDRELEEDMYKMKMKNRGLPAIDLIALLSGVNYDKT